ncbi:MAG: glycosyltransferase [Ignavibacteria bacterium]
MLQSSRDLCNREWSGHRLFLTGKRNGTGPNIVFTAWFKYYPNTKAAIDFVNNIFPGIKKEIPEIKFYIVGKEPPPAVKELEKTEGVIVTGYVDDVRSYLMNADAAVIPLQIGGGTRLKILEAMSMKVPVVSTLLGAEGLQVEDGREILIAQSDEDFISKVVKVIKDKELSFQLSSNGRKLMEEKYDWDISGKKLNSFLNSYVENFKIKKMKYDLIIQIINYNTRKYLETCLESLFNDLNGCSINFKIIVLDNDSDDDLSDLVKLYEGKSISFHDSDKNLGFGGGHNYMSAMEKSKYILILNSDIKFIEDRSVERLYKKLDSSIKYKVIGPRLVEEDMKPQRFDHGELQGVASWIKNNYGSSYWRVRDRDTEAAWVSGAVFLIERELFEKIKGFDENFFLYKEEEDLCKRVRDAGEKILYDPEVSVMHYGHVVAKRSEHFSNSMNYYLDKHFRDNVSYKIINAFKVVKDLAFYGKVRERE